MIDRERCLLITQGLPINVPSRSSYLTHEEEGWGGGVVCVYGWVGVALLHMGRG